jgi:8-amino-7-oxononanoate synthase
MLISRCAAEDVRFRHNPVDDLDQRLSRLPARPGKLDDLKGVFEELGREGDIDFVMGTFSKSVGTVGGFCVSNT